MKRATIKDKVLAILHRDGQIDNYSAIDSRLTIRLGDVIFRLKNEGKIEIDEERSGYVEGTKNYRYIVKPFKKQEYYVEGKLVATKFV